MLSDGVPLWSDLRSDEVTYYTVEDDLGEVIAFSICDT